MPLGVFHHFWLIAEAVSILLTLDCYGNGVFFFLLWNSIILSHSEPTHTLCSWSRLGHSSNSIEILNILISVLAIAPVCHGC